MLRKLFDRPLLKISFVLFGGLCALMFFTASNAAVLSTGADASLQKPHTPEQPAITKSADQNIVPVVIPHKAIYAVKLSGTRNGSRVSDISGRMLFSWSDDCHAWNVEQKMQLRFFYSEGEVSDTVSDLVSREAKDGSSFNFHTRRTGEEKDSTETFHGYANLNLGTDGLGSGEAVYSGENEKRISLAGALFPAHHTLQLLAHARKGDKFFSVNVFDGADEKGFSEISSFISPSIEPTAIVEKAKASKDGVKENHLTNVKAWPIRMAFFAPNSETGSPDYEMDMTLLDNGVIKTMTIDYGDYSMTADLVDAKPLKSPKCSAESSIPPS